MKGTLFFALTCLYFTGFTLGRTLLERDDEEDVGSSFIRNTKKLWKKGTVPYQFRDDRYSGRRYENEEKDMIRNVMVDIENQLAPGCIKFLELEESEGCEICVQFNKVKQDACEAHIGSSDRSYVTLESPDCFADNGTIILHELGHVLGLAHEQTRPDRDEYIEIQNDLLEKEAKSLMNKRGRYLEDVEIFGDTFKTPYDYFSIMHYYDTQGCKKGKTCIHLKQPYKDLFESEGIEVLKKYPKELSPVDIFGISTAYNCAVDPSVMIKYNDYDNKIRKAKAGTSLTRSNNNLRSGTSVFNSDTSNVTSAIITRENNLPSSFSGSDIITSNSTTTLASSNNNFPIVSIGSTSNNRNQGTTFNSSNDNSRTGSSGSNNNNRNQITTFTSSNNNRNQGTTFTRSNKIIQSNSNSNNRNQGSTNTRSNNNIRSNSIRNNRNQGTTNTRSNNNIRSGSSGSSNSVPGTNIIGDAVNGVLNVLFRSNNSDCPDVCRLRRGGCIRGRRCAILLAAI